MKLPRDLVLLFRPKLLPLFFDVTPATQNKIVARNRQAMAAQIKPKAISPSEAVIPLAMKSFRPIT